MAGASQYLTGVQGLRTVAALLVAVYHIWFGRVSGGVDVFFVVAGYFAAKSMLRLGAAERLGDRLRFVSGYLLRTARRVIPSAAVVLTGTIVAALLWMREDQAQLSLPHAIASMLHVENWWLIVTNADYLQSDAPPSPFQQFWALSLQVQFYLGFPLAMLLGIVLLARLLGNPRRAMIAVATTILVVSFGYSLYLTETNQPAAYFSTFTRLWEFMVGALLFLLVRRGFRSAALNTVLGLVGLVALVLFGAFFDLSAMFPGLPALVPVGAAVLIILSSIGQREPVLLRNRAVLWLADSSFAFYLWHWPILVFWQSRFGEDVSLWGGLVIIALALLLAVITTKVIETPIRNAARLKDSGMLTVAVCLLLAIPVAGGLGAWKWQLSAYEAAQAQARVDIEKFLDGDSVDGAIVPDPSVARDDLTDAYGKGCQQARENPEVIECWWGPDDAERTIALVGGSHSTQWLDAVRVAAEHSDARVRLMTKSACGFGDLDEFPEGIYPEDCTPWAEDVLDRLLEGQTDLVVTIATGKQQPEEIPAGYREYFERLSAEGIPVVAIRDNPRFDIDIPDCVAEQGAEACTFARSDFFVPEGDLEIPKLPGFTFVDIADEVCTETSCPPVRDNVLIYMDRQHLTRTFTMTYGDRVIKAVEDALAR